MKVSVITPIYNVHKFIEHGVHQVLNQTFNDFELIMVNDGSTDDSYEECQKMVSTDSRVRVLHQQNKGAGGARNLGIENAHGEYIYFYDIDDEIQSDLLEYCVGKMDELNVDFLCFGYENVETTYNSRVTVDFPETIITSNDDLKKMFVDQFVLKTNGFPWNKMYRKSFLDKHGLRYEDQRIQQDEVFNMKCYRYLERAYLSPKVLYTYYIYEKGNTRSRFIPDRFDIYKSVRQHFEDLKNFWGLDDKRLDDYLDKRFYDGVMQCFQFNLTHPDCKWTPEQKAAEMHRINSDALTQHAYSWAKENNNVLEQRLLRQACKQESLFMIKMYSWLFGQIHTLRRNLK